MQKHIENQQLTNKPLYLLKLHCRTQLWNENMIHWWRIVPGFLCLPLLVALLFNANGFRRSSTLLQVKLTSIKLALSPNDIVRYTASTMMKPLALLLNMTMYVFFLPLQQYCACTCVKSTLGRHISTVISRHAYTCNNQKQTLTPLFKIFTL